MEKVIIILAATAQISCGGGGQSNRQPAEFFQIQVENKFDDRFEHRREYFVVSNAPRDTLLLKKIVEEYNFHTIPLDTLKKYYRFTRYFYRETLCLTRNFEEVKPYPCKYAPYGDDPGQQIRYHSSDLMLTTSFRSPVHNFNYWVYRYTFGLNINGKFIEGKEVRIYDIDSLWSERGRKPLTDNH